MTKVTCTKNTWTKIASNIHSCEILRGSLACEYLIATRIYNNAAPTKQTDGTPIFTETITEFIQHESKIDIYIYAIGETGSVVVDTGANPTIGQILSMSNDALISSNYLDDYSVRGDTFNISRMLTVTSGATVKCAIDFSAVTSDREIFLIPLTFTSSGGYFKVYTYNVSTYASGTAIPFINLNENSLKTALTVFKTGVTSSDTAGTDKREYIVGGGSNPASSRGGSGGAANQIWIKRGTKKIIEIVNTTNASVDIAIAVVVIEAQAKND